MGGSSKSSNASNTYNTTKNTSGSVGLSGDNHGTVISGVTDSHITVTDHGAVSSALNAMSTSNREAFSFGKSVVDDVTWLARDVTKNALWFGEEAIAANEAVTRDVIDSNERVSLGVIDLSRDTIDFSGDIVRDALTQSERSTEMALDVASNISRDTDNATNQDAVKYMALAAVAVAVSTVLRA